MNTINTKDTPVSAVANLPAAQPNDVQGGNAGTEASPEGHASAASVKSKPARKGVRGPRIQRKPKVVHDSGEVKENLAPIGAKGELRGAEQASAVSVERAGLEAVPRKESRRRPAAEQQNGPRGPRKGAGGQQQDKLRKNLPKNTHGSSKAVSADDVFSYVISEEFDKSHAEAGHAARGGRAGSGKTVRRDLTADDDAPKLHKVLAEADLVQGVIWKN